jgi:hypothetical protein
MTSRSTFCGETGVRLAAASRLAFSRNVSNQTETRRVVVEMVQ